MFSLVSLSKSKFFTRVTLVSFVQHLCRTRVVHVELVQHLCRSRVNCVTLVSLVSHSYRSRVVLVAFLSHSCRLCRTRVVRVWHSCCKQTRSKNGSVKYFNSEYEFHSLLNDNQFLLLLEFFCCLEAFILLNFWFFIVSCTFIFSNYNDRCSFNGTYLIAGFYVNSEGSGYNFLFTDAG